MSFSIRVHLDMQVASESLEHHSAYFCHLNPCNVSADIIEECLTFIKPKLVDNWLKLMSEIYPKSCQPHLASALLPQLLILPLSPVKFYT